MAQFSIGSDFPGTLIRDDSLSQLKTVQDELRFRHIRFHNIVADQLGTYREVDGKLAYSNMITDRAIAPERISSKASLICSSLIRREISASSFSRPCM